MISYKKMVVECINPKRDIALLMKGPKQYHFACSEADKKNIETVYTFLQEHPVDVYLGGEIVDSIFTGNTPKGNFKLPSYSIYYNSINLLAVNKTKDATHLALLSDIIRGVYKNDNLRIKHLSNNLEEIKFEAKKLLAEPMYQFKFLWKSEALFKNCLPRPINLKIYNKI